MEVYSILGMMSGTSLDGLDLALCNFWKKEGRWAFEIVRADTISYSEEMKAKLKDAIFLDAESLLAFHFQYGTFLGRQASDFLGEDRENIKLVASHGHTVHHQPGKGISFQLGAGQTLANACELQVVCDFRSLDVSLGGEGAPLVPMGDKTFFADYSHCLNLGGISNVSFDVDGRRMAYDIGIANMLLNYLSAREGMAYDEEGKMARSGQLEPGLFKALNNLEYYNLPYPKSTGFEWFRSAILPLMEGSASSNADLLHTSVHHIGYQIAKEIKAHHTAGNHSLLITGGGAYNKFLIETLTHYLGSDWKITIPDQVLVSFKEALIFAFMGLLRSKGEVNVLSSVTGASRDSCSGVVYLPA